MKGWGCERDAEVKLCVKVYAKVCVRVCRHEDVGVQEWVWRGECGGVGVHVGGE